MATMQDLETAIDAILQHPLGAGNYQLVRAVAEKAYEAYVFCLCLRAVRELNANVELRGIMSQPNPFIFRGAPGDIYSTHRNYGYAFFDLNGHEFEIHAGVEFLGASATRHELDVSIVRHADAERCRTVGTQTPPPPASLIAGWECKFYSKTLDKVLGRAFVGLMDDMGANLRLAGFASNQSSSELKNFFRPQRRPYTHFELSPLNPEAENEFVNQLRVELRKLTAE